MSDKPEKETPEILWKYRVWGEHAKSMVASSELYYSQLVNLNDPLDCHWQERLPTDPREQYEYAKQLCNAQFPDEPLPERVRRLTILLKDIKTRARASHNGVIRTAAEFTLGVLCLSEINDDFLMWSHYADHHRGICVGIRTDRLKGKRIIPCKYCEDAPIIDAWEYVRRTRDAFVDASRCKATHWAYEKEWRTVHHHGPMRYPGCVESVVLGVRISDATRAEVMAAVADAGYPIKVYQALLHRFKYKLVILPVDEVTAIAESYRNS